MTSVVATTALALLLVAGPTCAQSLAEIAQAEAARRARITQHGWTYTDELLEPSDRSDLETKSASAEPDASEASDATDAIPLEVGIDSWPPDGRPGGEG